LYYLCTGILYDPIRSIIDELKRALNNSYVLLKLYKAGSLLNL